MTSDPIKKVIADQAFVMLAQQTVLTTPYQRYGARAQRTDDYQLLVEVAADTGNPEQESRFFVIQVKELDLPPRTAL